MYFCILSQPEYSSKVQSSMGNRAATESSSAPDKPVMFTADPEWRDEIVKTDVALPGTHFGIRKLAFRT